VKVSDCFGSGMICWCGGEREVREGQTLRVVSECEVGETNIFEDTDGRGAFVGVFGDAIHLGARIGASKTHSLVR